MKPLAACFLAFLFAPFLFAQEICNNGIDDDGDGLIDLNDPDCACQTLISTPGVESYIRNHSFEERTCCPFGFVAPPYTANYLACATGWSQVSGTTDYFNMCGYAPIGTPMPPPDGDGAVGMVITPMYKEFVGTCLTWPPPATPLLANVSYTLSFWLAGVSINGQITQTLDQGQQFATLFPDSMPIAVFGYVGACEPFPLPTTDCMESLPGWIELGRAWVRPAWEWQRVPITFTLADEIHSIVLGAACDIPPSVGGGTYEDENGDPVGLMSYLMVDELLLTESGDQVLLPVTSTGNLCTANVTAMGTPPTGATDLQWYLDGVALVGETGPVLGVSAGEYGAGVYTLACTYNGECLMGSTTVAEPATPRPVIVLGPETGCVPLTVAIADTSGNTVVHWDLGDGTTGADSAWVHTYTQPGTYDVSLTVISAAGCIRSITLPEAVTVHPSPNAAITVVPNPVDADDPTAFVQGHGQGNIVSWWWHLGDGDPPQSDVPSFNATFPGPGEYPVMLVAGNPEGCMDTVWTVICVVQHGMVEMPNVFSANGDGHNDRFVPRDATGTGLLEIYNRWGQRIFSTRNLAQGWDGQGVSEGTYFFIVTPDDPQVPGYGGHVTLLR